MSIGKHKLTQKALRRLTLKDSVFRELAVDIVREFIAKGNLFADDVLFSRRATTAPRLLCVAWRALIDAAVIQKTGLRRKSAVPEFRGGTVSEYTLVSRELALDFLRLNGHPIDELKQHNLFGVTNTL